MRCLSNWFRSQGASSFWPWARKRKQEMTHPQSTFIKPLPSLSSPFVLVRNRTGDEAGTGTRGPWERRFSLSSNGVWKRPNNYKLYCQLSFSKWKTDYWRNCSYDKVAFLQELLIQKTTLICLENSTLYGCQVEGENLTNFDEGAIKGPIRATKRLIKVLWRCRHGTVLNQLERLRFTFTPNGKREFVPRDQVFPLIVVNCLLLQLNYA